MPERAGRSRDRAAAVHPTARARRRSSTYCPGPGGRPEARRTAPTPSIRPWRAMIAPGRLTPHADAGSLACDMRAAVMRDRKLIVADVPAPEPGPGEVLVRTLACGICGSDLHALKHADKFVETSRRAGGRPMDLTRDVVMGHEFCAEIVEHGPRTARTLRPGTRVCSRPVLMRDTGPQTIGYSNDHPGGYGELMRLSETLLLPVPDGVPTEAAALTEPMAVGLHAVQKARLERDDAPLVIGCCPAGPAGI